jgi:hypothetical protein
MRPLNLFLCFFIVLSLLILPDCGYLKKADRISAEALPVSNKAAAEKAVLISFTNSGIPDGNGENISFKTVNRNVKNIIIGLTGPEFFSNKGYKVLQDIATVTDVTVSVDTLYVEIDKLKIKGKGKFYKRDATAEITSTFKKSDGSEKIYKGVGAYGDTLSGKMLKYLNKDASIACIYDDEKIITKVKPVLAGTTLTLLLWLLYSYRG